MLYIKKIMKKKLLGIILAIILVISGCSMGGNMEAVLDYKYDNSSYYSGFYHILAENEDGFFMNRSQLLFYINKDLKKGSLLSTQSYSYDDIVEDYNKLFDSDAYIGEDMVPVYIYNNKIYTLSEGQNDSNEEVTFLYEWPLEGSVKKKVEEFQTIVESCMYNGNLYFSEQTLDSEGNTILNLKSYSIKNDELKEIYEFGEELNNGININIGTMFAYEDNLYLEVYNDTDNFFSYLLHIDTKNGTSDLLKNSFVVENDKDNEYMAGLFSIHEGKILFNLFKPTDDIKKDDKCFVYTSDLDFSNMEFFKELNISQRIISNSKDIYIVPSDVAILSRGFDSVYPVFKELPLEIKTLDGKKSVEISDDLIGENLTYDLAIDSMGNILLYSTEDFYVIDKDTFEIKNIFE